MADSRKRKAESELPRGRTKIPAVRCADCEEYDTFKPCAVCGVEQCADCSNFEDNWCSGVRCEAMACHECMAGKNYEFVCKAHIPPDYTEFCSTDGCLEKVCVYSTKKECMRNEVYCALCKNPHCFECFDKTYPDLCTTCAQRCPHRDVPRTEMCAKCRVEVCEECILEVEFQEIIFKRCRVCPPTPGETRKLTKILKP